MTVAARTVAALLAWGAVLPAQETSIVHQVDGRDTVHVRVLPFVASADVGGFGFAVVEADNRDDAAHAVVVDYASQTWGQSSVAVRRELTLGPRELGRCVVPLPTNADHAHAFDLYVDGVHYPDSIAGRRNGVMGLLVTARTDREPWGVTVMNALARSAKQTTTVTPIAPDLVPADWRWLTGFHALLVDGRAQVTGELQAALVDFAAVGGTVVVGDADRLPAGELRDRCAAPAPSGVVAVGLGRCVPVAVGGDTTALRDALAAVPATELAGWPAPAVLLREQVVPGLGSAPVMVFLVVILLFAVLVGPVNFFLLRRWKRPLFVLVTVPACGLGTTLVMLAYGLLHDGLGVRGVVRSWTLLDQDRHEATSLAARTLFAGLSPDLLHVAPDGVVIAPRACWRRDRRGADRWQFDPVANVLDGGVVPSRTATPLLSARHGLARQRLRARRQDDRVELLTDGGVAPVGQVLLRDPDGAYWLGEAPTLRAVDGDHARVALSAWRLAAGKLTVVDGSGRAAFEPAYHLCERMVPGGELPPGGYVARVATAPWLDEHGLSVAYDAVEHYVAGRLAAEDFVR